MAAPTEFTLESVREFMLERGGKVTNHELVKHFKQFLTDPYTKEYARVQFKEYVNTLSLIRQDDGDKYLVLKPIFYPSGYPTSERVRDVVDPVSSSYNAVGLPLPPLPTQPQYLSPPHIQQQQQHYGQPPMDAAPAFRAPPPYRPPPEPTPFRRSSLSGSDLSHSPVNVFPAPQSLPYHHQPPPPVIPPLPTQKQPAGPPVHHFVRQTSLPSDDFIPASAYLLPQQQPMPERSVSIQDFTSPPHHVQDLTTGTPPPAVPPRRTKNGRSDDKENHHLASIGSSCSSIDGVSVGGSVSALNNEEIKISVKERTQRFNKMASEIDLVQKNGSSGQDRRENKSKSRDDDDTSSVGTMEPRAKEWMLATARGDYHAIARLLREEPRLARRRGCTPLHLAAMQGHAEVVDLLVKAYGADSNMRDYSGKKAHQYLSRPDTVISVDTFRKITAKRNLAAEKEAAAGFLRIGSLNVRVKKTTEAFNNLLSSAGGSGTFSNTKTYNKPWGSIDNLAISAVEGQLMPPPNKQGTVKKKRPKDWPQPLISSPTMLHHSNSFNGRPIQSALVENKEEYENDSDSAYGFGNNWQS
ncbi:hypothetical protein GHT06_020063 [Daphnia sinensis]|uniref:SOWAHA-C winged helix-turn-helix domain-containing protein n=1 Tax=Daphnia sinensis TaxID=1820382 RepID=A0AAD5L2G7_9CRUS|nr:hypothetical protein GHT06_020063 [Daphnia sinensis]